MATTVIKENIRSIINTAADAAIQEWILSDLEDMNNTKIRHTNREKSIIRDINHTVGAIKNYFDLINALNEKDEILDLISKINQNMKQLQSLEADYASNEKYYENAINSRCKDIRAAMDEYDYDIEAEEIYKQIIKSPGFEIKLPGVGLTVITPKEADKRIGGLKKFIYDHVEEIRNTPPEEHFYYKCIDNIDHIALPPFREELSQIAMKTIIKLNDMELRSNVRITNFVKYLNDILNLDVDIEIAEPETSKDSLFAEILQLCDAPSQESKNRLIELGGHLGYQREELEALTPSQVCKKLKEYFSL